MVPPFKEGQCKEGTRRVARGRVVTMRGSSAAAVEEDSFAFSELWAQGYGAIAILHSG
jgi:hypothetical protein